MGMSKLNMFEKELEKRSYKRNFVVGTICDQVLFLEKALRSVLNVDKAEEFFAICMQGGMQGELESCGVRRLSSGRTVYKTLQDFLNRRKDSEQEQSEVGKLEFDYVEGLPVWKSDKEVEGCVAIVYVCYKGVVISFEDFMEVASLDKF